MTPREMNSSISRLSPASNTRCRGRLSPIGKLIPYEANEAGHGVADEVSQTGMAPGTMA
jgi:hypothetical protein